MTLEHHEAGRWGERAPTTGQGAGVDGMAAWYCPGVGTELQGKGPFQADQLRPGDPYELSQGELVACMPTGGRGSGSNGLGVSAVGWDPAVKQAGVDTGYSSHPGMVRAPDVAIGNVPDTPGWVPGAPELAIEYADVGQNEGQLEKKIRELLAAGTKLLWVVRLDGPRRVEVHRRGEPVHVAWPGERLAAPGILRNTVLVESLYDRAEAERATLTNLLQRQGYESLEAVRDEARVLAARATLRRVLSRRGLALDAADEARIQGCIDLVTLQRWFDEALVARSAASALR